MRRLVSLLCLLLAPLPAVAEIVWKSGFETGDRKEWSSAQVVSGEPERLKVVTDVAREGERSLKATVVYGDKPIIASGNRNEVIKMTREEPGSEYWYRWSVRFGSTFPSERTWQLFTQWHHEGNEGSPPVEFYVYGEEIRLTINPPKYGSPGVIPWRTPLKRGVWYDFVFRVRWSPDPKVGLVELYLNGKQVLKPLSIATQFPGMRNYLKAGLYRNDTIKTTAHLYLDDFVIATTKADVMPPPVPVADAGVSGPLDAGTPTKPDAGTKGPVDAGTPSTADAGAPVRADAGTPAKSDAGAPKTMDAGVPAKALDAGTPAKTDDAALPKPPDAGVAPLSDAGTAPVDAGTKTQAGGLSGDAGTPDAGAAPVTPAKDGGVTTPPKKDGGCSAGGGDLLIPGALFTLAALRFGSYRLRAET